MSDIEEPPTKVTRYEMMSQYLEGEVEEDGQEEWLSEGILTDDDTAIQDHNNSNFDTSQDGTMASIDSSLEHLTDSQEATNGQNICADGQTVSISGNNVGISGQTVSISEPNTSTTKNASLNMQNATLGINVTTQGHNFIVDGTNVNVGGHYVTQDFEEALKSMEESQHNQSDFPEELNAFLIRKKDGKIVTGDPKLLDPEPEDNKQSDIEESPKHSGTESDGNDTDGLIRLLGGDEWKNKKDDDDETADEDDFNLEGPKMKTLRVPKKVSVKKYPASKAIPEDDDITDASSDEGEVVKKMFQRKVNQPSKVYPPPATVPKSTSVKLKQMETSTPLKQYAGKRAANAGSKVPQKPGQSVNTFSVAAGTSLLGTTVKSPTSVTKVTVTSGTKVPQVTKGPFFEIGTSNCIVKKTLPQLQANFKTVPQPQANSKTLPQPQAKSKSLPQPQANSKTLPQSQANSKSSPKPQANFKTSPQPQANSKTLPQQQANFKNLPRTQANAPSVNSVKLKSKPVKVKPADSDDDDEKPRRSLRKAQKQPMMKPEVMDEDVPTDSDSETDEETLYDELPSSEDEDLNEWFAFDIRAERAGDYIPLLGDKAEKILLEEKRRVSTRLANFRKSLSVLTETSRQQADTLRSATAELAELDAQIKAV